MLIHERSIVTSIILCILSLKLEAETTVNWRQRQYSGTHRYLLRLNETDISLSPQKQQVLLAPRGEYAERGHTACLELLLRNGANIEAKDNKHNLR